MTAAAHRAYTDPVKDAAKAAREQAKAAGRNTTALDLMRETIRAGIPALVGK